MILLFSCYFIRGNIGAGSVEKTPQIHAGVTARYLNVVGVTSRSHLSQQEQTLSLGLEFSPVLFFSDMFPIDEISSRPLQQTLLFSAIGVDLITWRLSSKTKVLLSPYFQVHSPPICLFRTTEHALCFGVYGEYQYQNTSFPSPHHSWHIGTGFHYGFGRLPL